MNFQDSISGQADWATFRELFFNNKPMIWDLLIETQNPTILFIVPECTLVWKKKTLPHLTNYICRKVKADSSSEFETVLPLFVQLWFISKSLIQWWFHESVFFPDMIQHRVKMNANIITSRASHTVFWILWMCSDCVCSRKIRTTLLSCFVMAKPCGT